MKTNSLSKIIFALSLAMLFVGCKPPGKTGIRTNNTVNSNTSGLYDQSENPINNQTTTFQEGCVDNKETIGSIYSNDVDQLSFENQVRSFLSATTNPNDIGSINSFPTSSGGVTFKGLISFDQSGQVSLTQTNINIDIYDSIAVQSSPMKPVQIQMNAASSGQFNLQTGSGSVTFKDSYGEIKFDGRLSAQSFDGQVSYKNYKNVVSGAQPKSGILGLFNIRTCRFIQKI